MNRAQPFLKLLGLTLACFVYCAQGAAVVKETTTVAEPDTAPAVDNTAINETHRGKLSADEAKRVTNLLDVSPITKEGE